MKNRPIEKTPLSEQLHGASDSALGRYRSKVLADPSLLRLAEYEFSTTLFTHLPGAVGYLARKQLFGRLFRQTGGGLILGRGLALRHPDRITLGNRVAIDDGTLLDASGAGEDGIHIGDDVILSRNCVVQGKTGPVSIGRRTDIGCNTVLSSVSGIEIGEAVLIAAACYIGGARYGTERLDIPFMDQGVFTRGAIRIGDGSWLGANVLVLDGVKVGAGCVVGAGAVVTSDLPPGSVAAGVPARILQTKEFPANE